MRDRRMQQRRDHTARRPSQWCASSQSGGLPPRAHRSAVAMVLLQVRGYATLGLIRHGRQRPRSVSGTHRAPPSRGRSRQPNRWQGCYGKRSGLELPPDSFLPRLPVKTVTSQADADASPSLQSPEGAARFGGRALAPSCHLEGDGSEGETKASAKSAPPIDSIS
jgi:hypothetical protein